LLGCFLLVRFSIGPIHFHGFYAQIIAFELAEAPKRAFRPLWIEAGDAEPRLRGAEAVELRWRGAEAVEIRSRGAEAVELRSIEVGGVVPLFKQSTAIGPMFTVVRAIEVILNDFAALTVNLKLLAILEEPRHHYGLKHVKEDSHSDPDANDGHLSEVANDAHYVNVINPATVPNDVQ
jgi:hypothetical protein